MPRIGIIGQVGVGKSTCCDNLHKILPDHELSLEPIPSTLKAFLDAQGTDEQHMRRLYHDLNIVKAHYRLLEKRQKPNVVCERPAAENFWIFGDRIEGSQFYNVYKELSAKVPLDILIYLHAAPDVVTERINKRARPGEEYYSREFAKAQAVLYNENYRNIANWHDCKIVKDFECSIKTEEEVMLDVYNFVKNYL